MIQLVEVPPSAHQLADWIELRFVVDGVDSFSYADLRAALGEPLMEEPPEEFDDFDLDEATVEAEGLMRSRIHDRESDSQSVTDVVVTDAMIELEIREKAMQGYSPYSVTSEGVSRTYTGGDLVQRFLTLLAARLHYHINAELPAHEPAILFERLVTVALDNMLGSSKRFGWPYREDGVDGPFKEAVVSLAELMGERLGNGYSVSPSTKDHRLDVAAWHSFNDGMPHQVVLLCQCGIGNDVEDKQLAIDVWTDVIAFSSTPLKALAFPTYLGEWAEPKQFERARVAGVLFDRIRIASLVTDEHLSGELQQDIERWCVIAAEKMPRNTV